MLLPEDMRLLTTDSQWFNPLVDVVRAYRHGKPVALKTLLRHYSVQQVRIEANWENIAVFHCPDNGKKYARPSDAVIKQLGLPRVDLIEEVGKHWVAKKPYRVKKNVYAEVFA